ncbi:MAG: hypothetical protein WC873_03840 [Candidatus Gracilibacteria bacterium]
MLIGNKSSAVIVIFDGSCVCRLLGKAETMLTGKGSEDPAVLNGGNFFERGSMRLHGPPLVAKTSNKKASLALKPASLNTTKVEALV